MNDQEQKTKLIQQVEWAINWHKEKLEEEEFKLKLLKL